MTFPTRYFASGEGALRFSVDATSQPGNQVCQGKGTLSTDHAYFVHAVLASLLHAILALQTTSLVCAQVPTSCLLLMGASTVLLNQHLSVSSNITAAVIRCILGHCVRLRCPSIVESRVKSDRHFLTFFSNVIRSIRTKQTIFQAKHTVKLSATVLPQVKVSPRSSSSWKYVASLRESS